MAASGDPPSQASFDLVMEALRSRLSREIRRRGLWQHPPSFLGIFGWRRWTEPDSASSRTDALGELAYDCYVYIFLDRLRSLQAQLQVKTTIEGLVTLNVRHFLLERQRIADPLGARLFKTLRTATRAAVESGDLVILAGDRALGPSTVLGFPTSNEKADPRTIDIAELGDVVATWLPAMTPDIVTAMGVGQRRVLQQLGMKILDLESMGEAFRFSDFSQSLVRKVRQHWTAILRDSIGGDLDVDSEDDTPRALDREFRPETHFEDWQSFRALERCVVGGIETSETRQRTVDYLMRIWAFCRAIATDQSLPGDGADPRDPSRVTLPSARKMARLLRIPRDRIPGLLETVRDLVVQCRQRAARLSARVDRAGSRVR